MADSLRQKLVDAVNTRFATITTGNGYETNIGAKLKEWQTTPVDPAQRPALLISDPVDVVQPDPQGVNSGKRTWKLRIVATAVLDEANQNAVQARKAIADIKKAVAVDQTWGGLAKRSEEVTDQVFIDKESARVGGPTVAFDIVTSRAPWTS